MPDASFYRDPARTYTLLRPATTYTSFAPGDTLRFREAGWSGDDQSIYVREVDGREVAEYVRHDCIGVPVPASPAEATDLPSFQALVVARSYERQVRHGLCGEVQNFLKNDLGLEHLLPQREVTLTVRVVVPQGPNGYYDADFAADTVRGALSSMEGVTLANVSHDVEYQDDPEPEEEGDEEDYEDDDDYF